jgi:hypothetical protein
MPHRLQQTHWEVFKKIRFVPQGPFGDNPSKWAARLGVSYLSSALPDNQLTRQQVRAECLDPTKDVMHGYICAMAWGLQGTGAKIGNAKSALCNHDEIRHRLTRLRQETLSRREAYDLFATRPINGLGPSYFTKLIYFFRQHPDVSYIMDQWTGKSIDLLTGRKIVRMDMFSPAKSNCGDNFDGFCRVIDFLAAVTGNNGDEVEQRLFSQNGQHRRPLGPWRLHVRDKWKSEKPSETYDHKTMMDWVAKLAIETHTL